MTLRTTLLGLCGVLLLSWRILGAVQQPAFSSWSDRSGPNSQNLNDITWGGYYFAAVGQNGIVRNSHDGLAWTNQISGTIHDLHSVTTGAIGASAFVAVGKAGTILLSSNSWDWIQKPIASTNDLFGVTWSGRQFVAVGANGAVVRSSDALSWPIQLPE
jgi:hypothetical protein